ncbi:mitochondrial 2-oxoglutarate/malate carrier protein-like isoform X8 [Cylas formicarius]|uniref:mitochondrial 2-oxoglutarate/malate carrier protein-like isoform X8 n=1 Tax=Cylas formicarius TaxID=197179 RepID=UPI0029583CCB|nr:mitochondrial 2-oxoglutarate/malate carrier protein-like isoform X8 [Cylas formicarius]XP_060525814.1 mitochondrial 2-oxoglutarate/malate carrier protein-like isoform X8 [Cylas formicarius]
MSSQQKPIPNRYKFLFGGSAGCCATCFVQPLDLLKNRMQMTGPEERKKYKTSLHLMANVIKQEGVLGLYNGLTAGLLRQATYTTTRLGMYTWISDVLTFNEKPPNFALKASVGMFAGVCGAFVGTPAEVALIRMTSDGRLPPDQRRNYKNVIDALIRIWREEGVRTWWRGAVPTMGRAMVVNAAQLATYFQAKQQLLVTGRFEEGVFLHFMASMISGVVTATASLPVDITKTRLQNMKTIDGKPEFGPIEVVVNILKHEGVLAFWKGLTPYYFRIGPHTVLTFLFLEQFNAAYRKYAA